MDILAIAAHPDDETLGCGGTLLRHAAEGDSLHWLVVTAAFEPRWPKETIAKKASEVEAVAAAYGMKSVHKLHLPTTQLESRPLTDLMDGLRGVMDKVKPGAVYLPHFGDVHTDHQVVFNATMSVLKTFTMKKWQVKRILSCEILSSTEAAPAAQHRAFVPTVFRDITPYLERKIAIMGLYKTEIHTDPGPRGPAAIRALARLRGAAINTEYAEAFQLVREVS